MNRAYNALRVSLKPGVTLNDRRWVDRTRMELLVNTVIASNVDIPYTDSYGDLLTTQALIDLNQQKLTDFYRYQQLKSEAAKNLPTDLTNHFAVEKAYQEFVKNKSEEEIWRFDGAVEKQVNAYLEKHRDELFNEAKNLVTGTTLNDDEGHTRYSVTKDNKYADLYSPVAGSRLNSQDLSVVNISKLVPEGEPTIELLKDAGTGNSVNPWYYENYAGEIGSYKALADEFSLDELKTESIDLAAYYLSKNGYNAGAFANKAKYYIRTKAVDSVYRQDATDNKCLPGLYLCNATNTSGEEGESESIDKAEGKVTQNQFEINYGPTTTSVGSEKPGLDKSSNKDSISTQPRNDQKETIDFAISLKVDRLKYVDALKQADKITDPTEKKNKINEIKKKYNNGAQEHMLISNALMVDILPEDLDLGDMKVKLEISDFAFFDEGANLQYKDNKDTFLNQVEIIHTDNLKAYLESLRKDKSVVSQARVRAIENFMIQYREKSHKGMEAEFGAGHNFVLAWLPEFEATHTHTAQFTLRLEGIKASDAAKVRPEVPNRTIFVSDDDGFVGYDVKTFDITGGKPGNFDKYLRLYDEEGKPVILDTEDNSENAQWFKGTTEVTFGDKFDYKLNWVGEGLNVDYATGLSKKWGSFDLTDNLPVFDEDNKLGFRPQLRSEVELKGSNSDLLTIIYTLNDYSEIKVTPEQRSQANSDQVSFLTAEQLSKVIAVSLSYRAEDGVEGAFDPTSGVELIIPMQVPTFKTEIVDGKISLAGDKFMDLAEFLQGSPIQADNQATALKDQPESSNKVTTKLTHEVMQIIKRWYEENGQESTAESLKYKPEVSFKLKRVARTFGYDETGNLIYKPLQGSNNGKLQLEPEDYEYDGSSTITVNFKQDYQKLLTGLQKSSSHTVYKTDGSIDWAKSTVTIYDYFAEELAVDGYTGHKEQVGKDLSLIQGNSDTAIYVNNKGQFINADGKLIINGWGKYLGVNAETGEIELLAAPENDPTVKDDRFGLIQVAGNTTTPTPEKPPTPPETPDTPDEPNTPPDTPEEPHTPPDTPDNPPTTPPDTPIIFIQRLPKTAAVQASWKAEVQDNKTRAKSLRDRKEPESADRPLALGEAQDLIV